MATESLREQLEELAKGVATGHLTLELAGGAAGCSLQGGVLTLLIWPPELLPAPEEAQEYGGEVQEDRLALALMIACEAEVPWRWEACPVDQLPVADAAAEACAVPLRRVRQILADRDAVREALTPLLQAPAVPLTLVEDIEDWLRQVGDAEHVRTMVACFQEPTPLAEALEKAPLPRHLAERALVGLLEGSALELPDPEPYIKSGRQLEKQQRAEEAHEAYMVARGVSEQPDERAISGLCRTADLLGKREMVIQLLEESVAQGAAAEGKASTQRARDVARQAMGRGDLQTARAYLETVLQHAGEDPAARQMHAGILAQEGDRDGSFASFSELAAERRAAGDREGAVVLIRSFLEHFPEDQEAQQLAATLSKPPRDASTVVAVVLVAVVVLGAVGGGIWYVLHRGQVREAEWGRIRTAMTEARTEARSQTAARSEQQARPVRDQARDFLTRYPGHEGAPEVESFIQWVNELGEQAREEAAQAAAQRLQDAQAALTRAREALDAADHDTGLAEAQRAAQLAEGQDPELSQAVKEVHDQLVSRVTRVDRARLEELEQGLQGLADAGDLAGMHESREQLRQMIERSKLTGTLEHRLSRVQEVLTRLWAGTVNRCFVDGRTYMATGDLGQAQPALRQVVEFAPESTEAAEARERLERIEGTLAQVDELIESARSLEQEGKIDEAQAVLRKVVSTHPLSPQVAGGLLLPVRVLSSPEGARVLLGDEEQPGVTPLVAHVPALRPSLVEVVLRGFQPASLTWSVEEGPVAIEVQLEPGPRWEADLDAGIVGEAAVAGDLLLVATSRGSLHGLDLRTGKPRWEPVRLGRIRRMEGGVTVAGRYAICVHADRGRDLLCVDHTTGKQGWTRQLPAEVSTTPRTMGDAAVVIGGKDGILYILDAVTGQDLQPPVRLGPPLVGELLVVGHVVYVGDAEGQLHRVDLSTEQVAARRFPTGTRLETAPVLQDGALLVGNDGGRLYVFDENLRPEWDYPLRDPIRGSAVLAGEVVVVPSGGGSVLAVARDGSEIRWTFAPAEKGGAFTADLRLGDGVIYAPCEDGNLYVLDSRDGSLLWKLDAGDSITTPVLQAGELLVVTTHAGRVLALER